MDQADQQINEYIEGLVSDCINSPVFVSLSPDRKQQMTDSIRDHLYKVIAEIVIGALDKEQFSQIEHLEPGSVEMANKIQDFASKIPNLHKIIEDRLTREVEGIKNRSPLS
ncbi:MAG: hypothetical protein PHE48_04715 [Candidatus Daviesbacteria bacterium]|nr:hypothetical protein [Candidatus Daviesbacteria bacterium]